MIFMNWNKWDSWRGNIILPSLSWILKNKKNRSNHIRDNCFAQWVANVVAGFILITFIIKIIFKITFWIFLTVYLLIRWWIVDLEIIFTKISYFLVLSKFLFAEWFGKIMIELIPYNCFYFSSWCSFDLIFYFSSKLTFGFL